VADPTDFRTSVYQTLLGKGLGPQQAMGVMYSLMGESGHGLDPKSYNPNDPGGAMGFAQWVGPRRAGLQATAKSLGTSETDPTAQLAYFNRELSGDYKGVIDNIKKNATSAADATRIWTADYESPRVNNWQQRYAAGAQLGGLDSSGSPAWKTAPVAVAPGAVPTVPTGPTPGPPTSVGDALTKLTTPEDKRGTTTPLAKLASAFSPQQGQGMQESSPMLQQAPPDQSMMLAAPAQQLLAASMSKPLSWTSQPYGFGLAGQIPGLTLNSGQQYG
jgi:hypothetical protein